MEKNKIVQVETRTLRWQCSGCDHLCAMLTDTMVNPQVVFKKCPFGDTAWRKIS